MKTLLKLAVYVLLVVGVLSADTITFEQFTDGDQLTNQLSGLQFTNATVATSGISLNEFEFPPHSGVNAVFDDGGPITIFFATPTTEFSGYFTYSLPITANAFGSAEQFLGSETSKFSSNLGISGAQGSNPNEFFQLKSALGISKITLSGDSAGGSFVMDDLSFQITPEPASLLLWASGLVTIYFRCRGPLAESGLR